MASLIDTTILARLANATDAQHAVAARAVLELHRCGEVLHITPQVLIEFRNVATRLAAVNGLGLSMTKQTTVLLYELGSLALIVPAFPAQGQRSGVSREAPPWGHGAARIVFGPTGQWFAFLTDQRRTVGPLGR